MKLISNKLTDIVSLVCDGIVPMTQGRQLGGDELHRPPTLK